MKTVLSIAGSDCSGGAGIQADIRTITCHGLYAMSVITALTAQNTLGVHDVMPIPCGFVKQQLECVISDILPDAVKIGMVENSENIAAVCETIKKYNLKNIVLDTVMISTSGRALLEKKADCTLVSELFPLSRVITPNIAEAEAICNIKINDKNDMLNAVRMLSGMISGAVLLKGGHLADSADDLLYENGEAHWFTAERIDAPNNHGTGCTLSSAIACGLAEGLDLYKAVSNAKKFVADGLKNAPNLGKGNGPLGLNFV